MAAFGTESNERVARWHTLWNRAILHARQHFRALLKALARLRCDCPRLELAREHRAMPAAIPGASYIRVTQWCLELYSAQLEAAAGSCAVPVAREPERRIIHHLALGQFVT